jgi:hypothetical protein
MSNNQFTVPELLDKCNKLASEVERLKDIIQIERKAAQEWDDAFQEITRIAGSRVGQRNYKWRTETD